jgi:hypothetical protein
VCPRTCFLPNFAPFDWGGRIAVVVSTSRNARQRNPIADFTGPETMNPSAPRPGVVFPAGHFDDTTQPDCRTSPPPFLSDIRGYENQAILGFDSFQYHYKPVRQGDFPRPLIFIFRLVVLDAYDFSPRVNLRPFDDFSLAAPPSAAAPSLRRNIAT